jgi:predicted lipid-binding transport protein (Tim44 family)
MRPKMGAGTGRTGTVSAMADPVTVDKGTHMQRLARLRRIVALSVLALVILTGLLPGVALARAGGGHVGGGGDVGGGFHTSYGGTYGGMSGDATIWLLALGTSAVVWFFVLARDKQSGRGGGGGTGAGSAPDSGEGPTSSPGESGSGESTAEQEEADDSWDLTPEELHGHKKTEADHPQGHTPKTAHVPKKTEDDGFDQIRADDPDFSESAFYDRVKEMFFAIQKAWEARDMAPARRFLSPEQFDVLQDGVGEYVRNGQINKLDGIKVNHVTLVSAEREGDSDYAKVLINATITDYTVDERTGKLVNPGVLGNGKTPGTFEENWTLVRKVGTKTKADSTIEKCPNCGAPVKDGEYVKCAYCGTTMNDPALDWVLLRIEQT